MRVPDDAILPPAAARPLAGRTILVTRAREQASALRVLLEAAGARVEECPAIRFDPPATWAPLDAALRGAQGYDWILVTSANTVRFVLERLFVLGLGPRALIGPRVVAIGPATAQALERAGLQVEHLPEEFRAEGIVELLAREPLEGARILLPRAAVAREILPRLLGERGARVDVVEAYCTATDREGVAAARALLAAGGIDAVTFTASSTVRALVDALGAQAPALLGGVLLAAIGPITAETLREAGLTAQVVAAEYTTAGLTRALAAHWRDGPA